jgi:hypothetical protein
VPSLPLSLSLPRGPGLSAPSSRARPLSLCPAVPTCQLVPNLPPTISSTWTRPRPHVLRPRPRPRTPFEPRALLAHLSSPICALYPTLSPSLSLCPRVQGAPPSPAVDHCLFCGRRRARALSSATVSSTLLSAARDTLRCAPSLSAASSPRLPEPHRRRPIESLRLRHCFAMPALPLKVSNLPVPLIWSFQLCCSRDCSPEQPHAAVSPPRMVRALWCPCASVKAMVELTRSP